MYPIFSYGSPRFSLGDLSVHFPTKNPAGEVVFEPREEALETLGGDAIPVFKGYRANVHLKLYNTGAQDYEKHLTMMNIINHSRTYRFPILLQPRFSSGATLNLWVYPKSEFGYKEITNLNAGQSIDLEFFSKKRLSELPLLVNRPRFLMLDDKHYLILSNAGNRLILPDTGYQHVNVSSEPNFN
jgi:hypothetical protein